MDHLFGFTGRETDTESGLAFYRARYYDPALGQFIGEDPMGFDAGDANLRRYVGNEVVNATDASGLEQQAWNTRAEESIQTFSSMTYRSSPMLRLIGTEAAWQAAVNDVHGGWVRFTYRTDERIRQGRIIEAFDGLRAFLGGAASESEFTKQLEFRDEMSRGTGGHRGVTSFAQPTLHQRQERALHRSFGQDVVPDNIVSRHDDGRMWSEHTRDWARTLSDADAADGMQSAPVIDEVILSIGGELIMAARPAIIVGRGSSVPRLSRPFTDDVLRADSAGLSPQFAEGMLLRDPPRTTGDVSFVMPANLDSLETALARRAAMRQADVSAEVVAPARNASPLKSGVDFEAQQLAELGLPKNNTVWRPTVAQTESAAFRVIVGKPKYTKGGLLKGTTLDATEAGLLEIKHGSSTLNSTYQLRLQTFRSLTEGTPYTIRTTRPVNPTFRDWLQRWGARVEGIE